MVGNRTGADVARDPGGAGTGAVRRSSGDNSALDEMAALQGAATFTPRELRQTTVGTGFKQIGRSCFVPATRVVTSARADLGNAQQAAYAHGIEKQSGRGAGVQREMEAAGRAASDGAGVKRVCRRS